MAIEFPGLDKFSRRKYSKFVSREKSKKNHATPILWNTISHQGRLRLGAQPSCRGIATNETNKYP